MIMRSFVGYAYFHYSFFFHLIAFQIMLCNLKKGAAANAGLVGHAQNSSFSLTPDMSLCRKLNSFRLLGNFLSAKIVFLIS